MKGGVRRSLGGSGGGGHIRLDMGANVVAGYCPLPCCVPFPGRRRALALFDAVRNAVHLCAEFDKAEAPSSVKKARPKRQQQQQQQGSRDARALKRSALAEDYFPSAADL